MKGKVIPTKHHNNEYEQRLHSLDRQIFNTEKLAEQVRNGSTWLEWGRKIRELKAQRKAFIGRYKKDCADDEKRITEQKETRMELFNRFDATDAELERFLFFSVAVAGKSAEMVDKACERFFNLIPAFDDTKPSPFDYIASLIKDGHFKRALVTARMGMYNKLVKCFTPMVSKRPNLKTITVAALEEYRGIGPKTARFFVVYTRRNTRHAVLDTHILAWLREQGYDVPKSTPTGKAYAKIELDFLEICDQRGVEPHELDNTIWQTRTRSYK